MITPARSKEYFITGGTLPPDAPSYIRRPADDDLLRLTQEGKICYVLTPRQMGKSSLMVRTAERLKEQGTCVAIIDLTEIGTAPPREWYLSLLTRLQSKLGLSHDVQSWWQDHDALAVVQRFVAYMREVVLKQIRGHIVVFLDEIDSTLNLDFRDDFFAAIRAMHDARATEPEFARLTFVLLGVATPDELMNNNARTPFNVGQRIDLGEFTRQETEALRLGLANTCPEKAGAVFDRILYWTGGHPYLTQMLCSAMLKVPLDGWNTGGVDGQVYQLFLSKDARPDTNLQTVQRNIAANPRGGRLLSLYRKVYQAQPVVDDTRSSDHNHLKLIGLVRARQNLLEVRNEIYRRVFDGDWIKKNMPVNRARWTPAIVTVLTLVLIGFITFSTSEFQARALTVGFNIDRRAETRLDSLARLVELPGQADAARRLFYSLNQSDKLALFNAPVSQTSGPQLITVINGVYTDIPNDPDGNQLLHAMDISLSNLDDPAARLLQNEIELWLEGRASYNSGDYAQAITPYTDAIRGLNSRNPGIYLDRAQAFARQNQIGLALDDLQTILTLNPPPGWKDWVTQVLQADQALVEAVRSQGDKYPALTALVP